jgi:hypothetical protein
MHGLRHIPIFQAYQTFPAGFHWVSSLRRGLQEPGPVGGCKYLLEDRTCGQNPLSVHVEETSLRSIAGAEKVQSMLSSTFIQDHLRRKQVHHPDC